jgi:membrane fusion protein (multidrug efflux system)
MRKSLLLILPVVLLALAAYGGWQWWTAWRFVQSTDDAYVQSDISLISPKIEGYIKEVQVRDNETVSAGQVLFVIDDRDFAAKLAQADAAISTTEATIATFESRLKLQQAMVEQAEAALASADTEANRTQLDFKRYASLVSTDFASRQRYETAEADAHKGEAALVKARAALAAEQRQVVVLGSQRREEESRLLQAQATRRLVRNDLDNTTIRAPVAGVVGNRAGQVGQYVKPGTQLASLVPLPRVYVTANFKETQLTRIRPGQTAEIAVDAYPDQPLRGIVESFAPASGAQFSLLPPDNATGNFTKIVQRVPVRIAVPEGSDLAGLLRPGLSVTVTVDTRQSPASDAESGLANLAGIGAAQAQPKLSKAKPAEPPVSPSAAAPASAR